MSETKTEVTRMVDLSHSCAKRILYEILVHPKCSREELRKIIVNFMDTAKFELWCGSEQNHKRWGDTRPHVIWLHIENGKRAARVGSWSCLVEWIDPSLDEDSRPDTQGADESIDGISIKWNEV